jgi:6-phosphofructokinase
MEPTTAPQRVCLLVGGGDAPGVNAVVRGFVHAANRFSIEVLGSRYGFEGLLAPDGLVPLGISDIRGILPRGGCTLGCSTRVNPFFVRGGPDAAEDRGPAIVDRLRSRGVQALVLVGGDGTTVAATKFGKLGMECICIPKTIDNDLGQTELACGFESAVETATRCIDALHSTAEAHSRVMLVEVMGRYAGFIALHSGMAGGADVILVPEIPYRLERVIAKIRERESLGLRFTIVAVAEGAKPLDGDVLEIEAGRPGHLARLGGAGERLRRELEAAHLEQEVRLTVLGHLQRGGSPTAFDRNLGTRLGTHAAELCHRREYGRRIVVRNGDLDSIPLTTEEAPLHKRLDPRCDPMLRSARLVGIELGVAPDSA